MIRIEMIEQGNEHLPAVKALFVEYANELGADLTFQKFDAELENPFLKYGPPTGCLFLAFNAEKIAGCIALQQIDRSTCEMKRMFVKPTFRNGGIGDALVKAIIHSAKEKCYERMVLDTLDRLQPAIKLYKRYGFKETTAYYANPLAGVVYMELNLSTAQ
jgi:putative acetyltransferase